MLTLRPFTAQDASVVATWFPDQAAALAFAGRCARWPVDPAELLVRNEQPDVEPLTATDPNDHGAVLGHVELVRVTDATGRLARIVLAPGLRGHGLSTVMLVAAIERARRAGIRELALLVVPGNTAALRAYAKVGFSETAPHPDHPEYVRLARSI